MKRAGSGQRFLFFALLCAAPWVLYAQEGHPYEGTWRGTIGSGEQARPIVIVMEYDGDAITGLINPGRNSYRFAEVEHDAPKWLLDVTATTRAGNEIAFSATMHDIGARNRYLSGNWHEAGQDLPFRVTRE